MESEPSAAGTRRATAPRGQRARLVASASAGVATRATLAARPCTDCCATLCPDVRTVCPEFFAGFEFICFLVARGVKSG